MSRAWGRVRRRPLWLLGGLLGAGLALVVWQTSGEVEESQAQQAQLQAIADPLALACADAAIRFRLGEAACATAQSVAAAPPADDGQVVPGPAGRGITATSIDGGGRLVVTYSDGSVMNAGPIASRAPADGRGIERSEIVDGGLVVTYSDGATENLGPVIGAKGAAATPAVDGLDGADGRGIDSVSVAGGRLVVTYSDGTTEDAGEVPIGPMGPQGERGEPGEPAELPAQYTRTFTDGTSETCSRANDDDSSPVWSCTDRG